VGVSRDCPIFFGYPHYPRNGKSCGFQIWPVYSEVPSEQNPIKNFGEKGAWAYPGTAEFYSGTPIISRTEKSYSFQIWLVPSEGPSEQKPFKNFPEKGASAYPFQGLPNFFGYPLLSQERKKLRISNFASTFRGSIRTKVHYKFRRKGIVGVSTDCPIFFGYPDYLMNG